MNVAFKPVGLASGLIAGIIAKKLFELGWGLIDDEPAPEAKHREVPIIKLLLALLLEGAVFRAVRGLADHGMRHGFARITGEWPGPERPTGDI